MYLEECEEYKISPISPYFGPQSDLPKVPEHSLLICSLLTLVHVLQLWSAVGTLNTSLQMHCPYRNISDAFVNPIGACILKPAAALLSQLISPVRNYSAMMTQQFHLTLYSQSNSARIQYAALIWFLSMYP